MSYIDLAALFLPTNLEGSRLARESRVLVAQAVIVLSGSGAGAGGAMAGGARAGGASSSPYAFSFMLYICLISSNRWLRTTLPVLLPARYYWSVPTRSPIQPYSLDTTSLVLLACPISIDNGTLFQLTTYEHNCLSMVLLTYGSSRHTIWLCVSYI